MMDLYDDSDAIMYMATFYTELNFGLFTRYPASSQHCFFLQR